MKKSKSYFVLGGLIIVILGVFLVTANEITQNKNVSLEVKTSKPVYGLGEIVNFEIIFQNVGNEDVAIWENAIQAGTIDILISKDKSTYKKYSFGGKIGGRLSILKPKETSVFQKSVIFNPKPNYSHLNSDYAGNLEKTENRILTDYVFPEAGVYFVKVVSSYVLTQDTKDLNKPITTIESEPIQITVKAPQGEDLDIWNKIKDRPDIAYFMQENEVRTSRTKIGENRNLLEEIEQILAQYPTSLIGKQLQLSKDKFVQKETERKNHLEKIKQQNKPQ